MSASKLELKRKAVEYYNGNKVPQQLEELLNSMFLHQPKDLYGYMSEHFAKLSNSPTINKINCWQSFSSSGHENITADVWCCIKGSIKHVCNIQWIADNRPSKERITLKSSSIRPPNTNTKSKVKSQKKDAALEESQSQNAATEPVKSELNFHKFSMLLKDVFIPLIYDIDILDQSMVDTKLKGAAKEMLEKHDLICCIESKTTTINEENSTATIIKENSTATVSEENSTAIMSEENSTAIINEENSTADTAQVGEIQDTLSPVVSSVDTNKEPIKKEINLAALFTSVITAVSAAKLCEVPLYRSLSIFHEESSFEGFPLPTPAIPFLCCDLSSPGKLNMFKEVLLLPKIHLDQLKALELLMAYTRCLEETLVTKYGAAGHIRNNSKILTPAFDKPEQMFELLTSVAKILDIGMSEYFDIIINVDATSIYDEDKKKYEMFTGTQKSSEDMVAMYSQWLTNYPILGIIDGLSINDEAGQQLLYNELSHKCYLFIGENQQITEENILKPFQEKICNSMVLHLDNFVTLSDIIDSVRSIRSVDGKLMLTDKWENTFNSSFFVDLSISLDVLFIRTSPPFHGNISSFERLLTIYHELNNSSLLQQKESYSFTNKLSLQIEDEPVNDGEDTDGER